MKVNGIIAEYNPFHNGHLYQMQESLHQTEADYTIVVMSGNFMQRGAPALLDKHTRAKMALEGGADLVLELPALYATASAEYFAAGGVALLDRLGVVNHLCFGSECGDVSLLQEIATILSAESTDYSATIKELLRQGYSYPNARNQALLQHYPHLREHSDVFSSPNNILGIEYCKALLTWNSHIKPFTIKRADAGYHSEEITGSMCSATAIRKLLCEKHHATQPCTGTTSEIHTTILQKGEKTISAEVATYIPAQAFEVLTTYLEKNPFLHPNDFSSLLYYKLLTERENGYESYLDVSPDLSDRIQKRLNEFRNFESFCDLLKTKETTHTRISRCLLHILLHITKADMEFGKSLDYIPYARVLGFRKDSTELLGAIKEHSSIPLITKLADAEKILDEDAYRLLKKDILVSEIYHGIVKEKLGIADCLEFLPKNEFTTPIVIV